MSTDQELKLKAAQALADAAEFLEEREWVQGYGGRIRGIYQGTIVQFYTADHEKIGCCCGSAALAACCGEEGPVFSIAEYAARRAVNEPVTAFWCWNDKPGRTKEQVVGALRRAARAMRSEVVAGATDRWDVFENMLVSACEQAKKDDVRIVQCTFGVYVSGGCCCPMTALVKRSNYSGNTPAEAALRLGVTEDDVWSFVFGFDGRSEDLALHHDRKFNRRAYETGQAVRKRVLGS